MSRSRSPSISEGDKREESPVPDRKTESAKEIGRNVLWLPGVSRNVSVAHMEEIMGTFGPCRVELEKSKNSVEHSFTLTFETEQQGIDAQKYMNDGMIDGQRITVQFLRNKGKGRREGDRKRDRLERGGEKRELVRRDRDWPRRERERDRREAGWRDRGRDRKDAYNPYRRRRSISPGRFNNRPRGQSPYRRSRSPPRRTGGGARERGRSRSPSPYKSSRRHSRSPSPYQRRRSPRRSPSPYQRRRSSKRSPSPTRRSRSPYGRHRDRRSRSPPRRSRSPPRRSRSPPRRSRSYSRSPTRRGRSPARGR